MLIVKSKRYVRKHVVGGAGIFDTVSNFFKRLSSSGVSRSVATNISKAAASDIGKSAINAAKAVGKERASSAISTAKDIAIDKGKQLIAKFDTKAKPEPRPELTQESKDILASLVHRIAQTPAETTPAETKPETTNLNQLLAGKGLKTNNAKFKAVKIQDMVRTLNGGGLRLA